MYADFECILELIQGPGNNPMISSTRGVHNHVCSKFACNRNIENPFKLYRGKECIQKCCDHVIGHKTGNNFQYINTYNNV